MKGKATKENQKPGEIASPNICESKLAGVALEGGRRDQQIQISVSQSVFLECKFPQGDR